MTLDAIVKEDGTLIINTPESFWGKKVKVRVQAEQRNAKPRTPAVKPKSSPITEEQENQASLAQWEQIKAILHDVDHLDFPRRTIEEILHDLHEFRESERAYEALQKLQGSGNGRLSVALLKDREQERGDSVCK